MPFASSNVRMVNLGGGFRLYSGEWSGAAGDADGTLTVMGTRLCQSEFKNAGDSGVATNVRVREVAGVTNGTMDLNVSNNQDVTNGRFCLITA